MSITVICECNDEVPGKIASLADHYVVKHSSDKETAILHARKQIQLVKRRRAKK